MFVADNVYTTGLASDGAGEHQDPGDGEILATTDAQPAGHYHCLVTITAIELDDSKALFEIQHRNSDDEDTNVLESLIVAVQVDSSQPFECAFMLEENERISVVPYPVGFVGRVMVAINWQRVA